MWERRRWRPRGLPSRPPRPGTAEPIITLAFAPPSRRVPLLPCSRKGASKPKRKNKKKGKGGKAGAAAQEAPPAEPEPDVADAEAAPEPLRSPLDILLVDLRHLNSHAEWRRLFGTGGEAEEAAAAEGGRRKGPAARKAAAAAALRK